MLTSDLGTILKNIARKIIKLVEIEKETKNAIYRLIWLYKGVVPESIRKKINLELINGWPRWRIKLPKGRAYTRYLDPIVISLLNLNCYHSRILTVSTEQDKLCEKLKKISEALKEIQGLVRKLSTCVTWDSGSPLAMIKLKSLKDMTPEELEALLYGVEFNLLQECIEIEEKFREEAPSELYHMLKLLTCFERRKFLPVAFLWWYYSFRGLTTKRKYLSKSLLKSLSYHINFLCPFINASKNYNIRRLQAYSIFARISRIVRTILKGDNHVL